MGNLTSKPFAFEVFHEHEKLLVEGTRLVFPRNWTPVHTKEELRVCGYMGNKPIYPESDEERNPNFLEKFEQKNVDGGNWDEILEVCGKFVKKTYDVKGKEWKKLKKVISYFGVPVEDGHVTVYYCDKSIKIPLYMWKYFPNLVFSKVQVPESMRGSIHVELGDRVSFYSSSPDGSLYTVADKVRVVRPTEEIIYTQMGKDTPLHLTKYAWSNHTGIKSPPECAGPACKV